MLRLSTSGPPTLSVTLGLLLGLAWSNRASAQDGSVVRGAKPIDPTPERSNETYRTRHAIVIGIDHYSDSGFPDLSYAVADAQAFAKLLIDKLGFDSKNILLRLNADASKQALEEALQDWAADPVRIDKEDLLIVFFAGHGETRDLPSGKQEGYLVPADGKRNSRGEAITSSLLGMWQLSKISEAIPAKHALFMLDCCFGGLAVHRAVPPVAPGLTNRARQVITAGTKGQTVQDGGGSGHSVFTAAMLDGIGKDKADGNLDGVVTFGELYQHVYNTVVTLTEARQTPLQAELPDHDGGNVSLFPPDAKPGLASAADRLNVLKLTIEEEVKEKKRFSDIVLIHSLAQEADQLWPRHPDKVSAMRSWLAKARELFSYLPEYRAGLKRVREEAFMHQVSDGLITEGASEPDWSKAGPDLRWRFETSTDLVDSLTALVKLADEMEARLAVASAMEKSTIDDYSDEWSLARREIAESPFYHALDLKPQVGLVPLESDPKSGLFEFWLWETGDRPERNATTGRYAIMGSTGMVMVLLPGGTFTMGAQSSAKTPNYDAQAEPDEGPPNSVTLAPFFISKYEMTNGQWSRLVKAPVLRRPDVPGHQAEKGLDDLNYPIADVSYLVCFQATRWLGLALPTEAQWEYAARGGTDMAHWTGKERDTLQGAENISDRAAGTFNKHFGAQCENWNDGFWGASPVGTFQPNPFGLYDVLGNVWEWCRDYFDSYRAPVSGKDAERQVQDGVNRVVRGGCWFFPSVVARSTFRHDTSPVSGNEFLGLRPIREIDP